MDKLPAAFILDSYALLSFLRGEPCGGRIAEYPISYADAFAASLAQEMQATLVTGDPEFKAMEKKLSLLWLE